MKLSPSRFRPKPSESAPSVATCLNCGAEVLSKYCPECSQANEPLRLGVGHIFQDALEEFVKFDSKLFNTLKPLLFKPGFLTQEWARGRRVGYISPFKLYLTSTFIFFILTGWDVNRDAANEARVKKEPAVSTGSTKVDEAAFPTPASKKSAEETVKGDPVAVYIVNTLDKMDRLDQTEATIAVIDKLPTALFFLLPIFAAALKFFYIRSGRYYVEHLIFALHLHAYFFVILSIVTVLPWDLELIGLAVCGGYAVLALKRYYMQSWPKTLFKASLLGSSYVALVGMTLLGAMFAGLTALPDPEPVAPKAAPPVTPKNGSPNK